MSYIENTLKGKTVLITGGAGFIGSNLAFYFQKNHPETKVIVFDKFRDSHTFPSGNPTSLGHFKNLIGFKGEVIIGDINNFGDLETIESLNFDYIFHQAAISDTTVLDQELVMRTNYEAFLNLLDIASDKKAVMIYASSAGTYGNSPAPNGVGNGEEPENIYGFSKLCMDQNVRKILQNNPKAPIIGLRYFNVYGQKEFYKGRTASMILQLGLQALENKKVKIFEFGEQKRDFVYIEDVIQANIKAMEAKKGGIYNVGYGKAKSYNDIIKCLKNELGEFEVQYIKNPYKFFQTHTEADIQETITDLKYEPKFDLESGIKSYIRQIKEIYEGIK
ncbi:ADP-glyceromanno-heptose 6-epimerase [Helicobacter sp. 12S02232-10]|uniref:ADP-glyceromanno-heptose 6-epimerase n=1 Tax=Helicobacter sp. 12S02232-10 TaxID=1476197 RepID=UPI000BA62991|nr:ADP-glyceromanno-heptose 6-epimerase [Helicobacter sp. 12S02232-10]PAF49834.1 ADP-glyceromanno-heptose 6-epimerase [Helicobacter sp. 12S02232-10]